MNQTLTREQPDHQLPLADLLGFLLCAGGPSRVYCRFAWPAHNAVRRVSVGLGADVETHTDAMVGSAVVGFAEAIRHLVGLGVLIPEGTGETIAHSTDSDRLRPYRRRLMRLPPTQAAVIARTAARWTREQRAMERYLPQPLAPATTDVGVQPTEEDSQKSFTLDLG